MKLKRLIKDLPDALRRKARRVKGVQRLKAARAEGLPDALAVPLDCLLSGRVPEAAKTDLARVAEARARIAARGEEKVPIYYSPKPVDPEIASNAGYRPEPGEVHEFTAEKLARDTSVPVDVGTLLHTCVRHNKCKVVVELGSCVGIGTSYLGSHPDCHRIVTIEASEGLAKLARESIDSITPNGEVINALFDDALDKLLPDLKTPIDFAWIDGHHERTATQHYFERLKPHLARGAVVAFDDIYWSDDMFEGWKNLRAEQGFSHTVDAGVCGLGLWEGGETHPRQWDLTPYVRTGQWTPRKPAGWKSE